MSAHVLLKLLNELGKNIYLFFAAGSINSIIQERVSYDIKITEGLYGGVWYSLFIKNLAHYSSH